MDMNYYYNSSADEHADLAAIMMEMEKYPDFFAEASSLAPTIDLSLDGPQSSFGDTPPATPPTPITPPSIESFSGTPTQDAAVASPAYAHATSAQLRSPTELSCDDHLLLGQKQASMVAMREMIFRISAMQPIHIDPESVKPPKRRNVRISNDPQSVAARHRRERISERIRILQRLVPGGTKMDTASMLDEAIHYVKFLKMQVQSLERAAANRNAGLGLSAGAAAAGASGVNYSCFVSYDPQEQQLANHSWMWS